MKMARIAITTILIVASDDKEGTSNAYPLRLILSCLHTVLNDAPPVCDEVDEKSRRRHGHVQRAKKMLMLKDDDEVDMFVEKLLCRTPFQLVLPLIYIHK